MFNANPTTMNTVNKPKINIDSPIQIIELKIQLDTNIEEMRKVAFERKMLYVPTSEKDKPAAKVAAPPAAAAPPAPPAAAPMPQRAGQLENIYSLNENPYFSFSVEYPVLKLAKYKYEDIIQFFFNIKKF